MKPYMTSVLGVILAGGQGRRMQPLPAETPQKFLLEVQGQTLIQRVINLARPQVDALIINTHWHQPPLVDLGYPLVADMPHKAVAVTPNQTKADTQDQNGGPLLGVLSSMRWAKKNYPSLDYLITFAADTPYFPDDLVAKLLDRAQSAEVTLVQAGTAQQDYPTFALWSCALLPALEQQYAEGTRALKHIMQAQHAIKALFPAIDNHFFNINTFGDFQTLQQNAPLYNP